VVNDLQGRFHLSEETLVTSSESITGPSHGVVGQDPFWSGDFRRVLFGTESPVYEINPPMSPEPETTPETTTYRFVLPPEMAHLAQLIRVSKPELLQLLFLLSIPSELLRLIQIYPLVTMH
jgi:hypothetical protein